MMTISSEQTRSLLAFVSGVQPDELDCDGCLDQMAAFVENELAGTEVPEALKKVQRHLDQCACCNDEHNALMEGLLALEM